jgi:glutathione synthase/RimK-type ligase-like ATP-grasp enzyme
VTKVIGLVMGDEPLVEQGLVERIRMESGVRAERVIIGGTAERHIIHHEAIFDRMSHLVPHYRTHLRAAALAGANVVNDPFAVADDKFFALSLAARLGHRVPRAVLLPQKGYGHGVDPSRMLGNLQYPLLWDEIGHYVGFPAVLAPARTGSMHTHRAEDVAGLVAAFDQTWDVPMMVRADIPEARARFRCVCIGGERAVAVEVGGSNGEVRALEGSAGGKAEGALGEAIDAALKVSAALGLDLNAVEVVLDDKAWIVDALDPLPHLAPHILGSEPFETVMDRLAEHLLKAARRPQSTIRAHPFARAI